MKIIQIGNAKSGNFWLYKILKQILISSHQEPKSFIQHQPIYNIAKTWKLSFSEQADIDNLMITPRQYYYRISSIFEMPIENLDDYVNQCGHVWLQSPPCELTPGALSKFDKVIYIIRDPRDVAISNSQYAFTPYRSQLYPIKAKNPDEHLNDRLKYEVSLWVGHVGGYLKLRNALKMHVIFYERLVESFESELAQLLDYLNIELDQTIRDIVREKVSFSHMRHKDPHHVRQGKIFKWRDILTEKQKKLVVRMSGPMLKLLNYPMDTCSEKKFTQTSLPLATSFDNKPLEKAMSHAQRQFYIEKIKNKFSRLLSLPH